MFFSQLNNAIGEYPLLRRNFPGDSSALDVIERLLSDADVPLELEDSVTFSMCAYFLTLFTPLSSIDPSMV